MCRNRVRHRTSQNQAHYAALHAQTHPSRDHRSVVCQGIRLRTLAKLADQMVLIASPLVMAVMSWGSQRFVKIKVNGG